MKSFQNSLGMKLRAAYLSMHRAFQEQFAERAVTADQFVVLSLLAEEEGINQRELTARTFSDPNTVTAILQLLERKQLIKRVRSEQDGRARLVFLTTKGRRLQLELAQKSAGFHRQLQQAIPATRAAEFDALLAAVTETMCGVRKSSALATGKTS